MRRFMIEYANYKVKNSLLKGEEKQAYIIKLNKVLSMRKRGLITVDETMKMLTETTID